MKFKQLLWQLPVLFATLWLGPSMARAGDCAEVLQQALANAAANCASMGANQICFGNGVIEAIPQGDASDLAFSQPGDIVDLTQIDGLSVASYETEWSVAVIKLESQPNGTPVTLLVFGNVVVNNTADEMEGYAPLQAFQYDAQPDNPEFCPGLSNGVWLQSEPGGETVMMNVNGVEVLMGSTVVAQGGMSSSTTLATLAGVARITSGGVSQTIIQGVQTSVATSASGATLPAPGPATPINNDYFLPATVAINASTLVVPTYVDAAANATIMTLSAGGQIPMWLPEDLPLPGGIPMETVEDTLDLEIPLPSPRPQTPPVNPIPVDELILAPINGIWFMVGQSVDSSGGCDPIGVGDNGGPDRDPTNPDDPQNQADVCTMRFDRALSRVYVQGQEFQWNDDLTALTTSTVIDSFDNSQRYSELTVLSETEISITTYYISPEGCTVTVTRRYRLHIPGNMYSCSVRALQVAEETGEDVTIEPEPEEPTDPEDEPTEETPVVPGQVIGGTYIPSWWFIRTTCPPELMPNFTSASLVQLDDETLQLTIDGVSYELFGGGGITPMYDYYEDTAVGTIQINLERRFANDFRVFWNNTNDTDLTYCDARGVLTLSEALPADQQHIPSDSGLGSTGSSGSSGEQPGLPSAGEIPAGTYTAAFTAPDCSADLLPENTAISVTFDDPLYNVTIGDIETIIVFDGQNYILSYATTDLSETTVLTLSNVTDTSLSGEFVSFNISGAMCLGTVSLDLE